MSQKSSSLRIQQEYFFHADAVAIAGQIRSVTDSSYHQRPGKVTGPQIKLPRPLPIDGVSCALPGNGGISETTKSKARTQYGGQNLVSFDWARARTQGQIAAGIAVSRVAADFANLQIGDCEPLFLASGGGELRVGVPVKGPGFSDLRLRLRMSTIEVHGGTIEVDFQDVDGVNQMHHMGLEHARSGQVAMLKKHPKLCHSRNGISVVHLVKQVKVNAAKADVTKEGDHGVYIRDIGYIFFGEAVITPEVQRVSLMRFELGCGCEGEGTGGTLGRNGG